MRVRVRARVPVRVRAVVGVRVRVGVGVSSGVGQVSTFRAKNITSVVHSHPPSLPLQT